MTVFQARHCLGAVLLLVAACSPQQASDSRTESSSKALFASQPNFGDPLAGLSADDQARFAAGQEEFASVETVADGLGPVFNEASCAACHVGPNGAIGGTNQRLETRFGFRRPFTNKFDPLANLGGSLLQDRGIGLFNGVNFVAEKVPRIANVTTPRRTTPLFGLGLVDATPSSTFFAIASSQARNNRSIGGTPSIVTDPITGNQVLGKFGWKAQVPSLFVFSGDAYLNEMGITNPIFPNENCPQGNCALLAANPVPTLNDDGTGVEEFNDFMTLLAPPPRGPQSRQTDHGNDVARAIGCLDCHVQTLRTGPNAVPALDQVAYHPFSDFLLHDMGQLGDGITQGQATGRLMRTQPLWGLRTQTQMLHDGSATTITGAILAHDGQARDSRRQFERLGFFDRAALLAFLNSL
ncbi:MAG TPA: di-heme oxidoredictase family protein [Myxococcales bacterium]|nr:di-heme oxidoredictase family protein [Myxococcales bacterium]